MRALGAQCWMVASAKRKLLTICITIAPGDMKKMKKKMMLLLLQQTTGVPWNNSRRRISLSLCCAWASSSYLCVHTRTGDGSETAALSELCCGRFTCWHDVTWSRDSRKDPCLPVHMILRTDTEAYMLVHKSVCEHLCMVRVCIWDTAAACLPAR